MSSVRNVVVAGVLVVFVAVGALLVFGTRQSAPAEARTIDLKITGGKMDPERPKVHEGDTVIINVLTDKDEEIHLHGYEKKFEAKAGEKSTQAFVADKSGTFDIGIEDSSKHLGSLEVDPR
jgi:hypothetical protein